MNRPTGPQRTGRLARARAALLAGVREQMDQATSRLGQHVAHCPRCRRRLRRMGRLRLAMRLLRAEPRPADLLQKANATALEMLQRPIRTARQAQRVRNARDPRPRLRLVVQRHTSSALAAAACLLVLVLARFGLLNTFDTAHRRGQSALRERYLTHVGADWTGRVLGDTPPHRGA